MTILESKVYNSDLINLVLKNEQFLKELSRKSIVVTGSTGLIGSAIIDILLAANRDLSLKMNIYAFARNREQAINRFGSEKLNNGLSVISYDAMAPIKFNEKVDYIIHGASNASPELYTTKPVETMTANFIGMLHLLNFAKEQNISDRIVYISSSEVYGKINSNQPLVEDNYGEVDILNPRSSYSSSKRATETLCVSFYKEYGVKSIIVRPGHIYGPSSKKNDNRVSSAFVEKAIRGEKIIMKSLGNQKRSYMYSLDCAMGILYAMTKGIPGEAYNIANPNSIITIAEMAEIISSISESTLEFDLPTQTETNNFNPMLNASLASSKLENLGWQGYFDAKTGFEHTLATLKEIL